MYSLETVSSLPVLLLYLGPDNPLPFKRSLFGGGDYQSLGTSIGRELFERVSQSGVPAPCPTHPPWSWGLMGVSTISGYGGMAQS